MGKNIIFLKEHRQRQITGAQKDKKRNATYRIIHAEYPRLTRLWIHDLLQIDGYSDVAIAFGAGIPLDQLRKIIRGESVLITPQVFFGILGLYARVFCHFFYYREQDGF